MVKQAIRQISVTSLHSLLNNLPPEMRKQLGTFLIKNENFPILQNLLRWYYQERPVDAYLISFPKCGRTWLRLMIGRAFAQYFGLIDTNILQKMLKLAQLADLHPAVPKILVTHDDDPHWKKPQELITSKAEYKNTKVIFLVRDPRDVVISTYFEQTKRASAWVEVMKNNQKHLSEYADRIEPYKGDLSSYLYEDIGSLKTLIKFYNIWAESREVPQDFLLVRYEDIHANPDQELKKILSFLGWPSIPDSIIAEAIKYASFDNMRKMETEDQFNSSILRPTDKGDENSYKTRKGKVGGFKEYLQPEEIEYLDNFIKQELTSFYGY